MKQKFLNLAMYVLLILCIFIFLFSFVKVIAYWKAGEEADRIKENMIEMAVTKKNEIISTDMEALTEDSLETAPIAVDFATIQAQNKDIVAWLYCPDTPINYPVVQSENNDDYLRMLTDGRQNTAGTLFIDYRNSRGLSDWNTMIYGHNMKNQSMFGTIPNYKKQSYYEEHPVMYLLTPDRDYKVLLFSGYITTTEDNIFHFSVTETEKEELALICMEHSVFASEIKPGRGDHFLTLATCSYESEDARFVLIGVLKELSR